MQRDKVGRETSFLKIWRLALPYLKNCRSEDLLHTKVVVSLTEKIIKGEKLEKFADILIPAAILHDLGWSQIEKQRDKKGRVIRTPEARINHMKEGAKLARKILEAVNYPKEKIVKICRLILVHDNQYLCLPVKDELAKRLVEADNLWVLTKKAIDFYCCRYNLNQKFLLNKHQAQIEKFKAIQSPTAIRIKNDFLRERKREVK